jgi:hypothetical protein
VPLTGTGHASRGLKLVVQHLIHGCQDLFGPLVINGDEIVKGSRHLLAGSGRKQRRFSND